MSTQLEIAERIDDIKVRLEKGVKPDAAMVEEFAAKWNTGKRTVERYIGYAKDILDGQLKKREIVIQEIRAELITEEIRNSILSNLELEAKLCEIIEGKLPAEKIVRSPSGGYERITCLPSHHDIICAIDKLFRRRGGYDKVLRLNETPTPIIKIVVDNEREAELLRRIKEQSQRGENGGED